MANVITAVGKSLIAARLKAESTEPNVLAWGLNPNSLTAANTDIALFEESPESRVAGTASLIKTTSENDTYQTTGTMTATSTRAIREAAVTNSTTKPAVAAVAAGGVVGSTSSETLNTAATFTPGNGSFIQIRTEVMEVTAGSGTTALTVKRAKNGSSAIGTIAAADVITVGNIPGPFSTAAKGAATTGATVFLHADLSVVNLNSGDSIVWTWQLQLS